MSVLKFCCIAILLLLLSIVDTSAQVDCAWPEVPGCTDDWNPGSMNLWLEVSSTPPCSVMVTVYYQYRCLQVEVQDFALSFIQTNPNGCASPAQIYSFMNSASFRNQVSIAVSLQFARDWILDNPGSAPHCPTAYKVVTTKFGSCRKPMILYSFPNGSTTSVSYNPANSWSYYQNLYSGSGGVMVLVQLVVCNYDVCCFREFTFCVDDNSAVQWTIGGWVAYGTCPFLGPCTYKFCD